MKKLLSILLLFLLTYNMMGYYLMFAIRHYQVKQAMSIKIDEEAIVAEQMIVFKIPVNLPYSVDWSDYEKVSGSFRYEGRFYEKVKQILKRDTMIVYCVENKGQGKLFDELGQHTRAQLPDISKKSSSSPEKKFSITFIKEYLPLADYSFIHPRIYLAISYTSHYLSPKYFNTLETLVPPPQNA